MGIRDVHNPWRDALLPAMFDGCPFHVESGGQAGGRRIVVHQFPKRDDPYAEDMGRRATELTVRGYCISFGRDSNPGEYYNEYLAESGNGGAMDALAPSFPLYMRDYRISRDVLQQRLDMGGDGILQLPNSARGGAGPSLAIGVVCTQYRMTEEQRFGGFCVFDMTFAEFGRPASVPVAATGAQLIKSANDTLQWTTNNIAAGPHTGP
jgi:hypothetical protein